MMFSRVNLKGILLATLGSALLLAPPAWAAGKPDLIVRSLSAPPKTVARTAGFVATTVVWNKGNATAKASATAFYLFRAHVSGSRRIMLTPLQAGGILRRGAVVRTGTVLTVPSSVAPGSYFVIACADVTRKVRERSEVNNCRVAPRAVKVMTARKPPAGRSSSDLIDAAVAAHRIGAETGLLYRVYAFHRDPQLPPEYRGDDSKLIDDGLMAAVAGSFKSYSAATRAKLEPFLVAPYYAASWWAMRQGKVPAGGTGKAFVGDSPRCGAGDSGGLLNDWMFLDTTAGNFRIWWAKAHPADGGKAASMGSDLEGTIFPKLAGLMAAGKARPLSDNGSKTFCRGGSDAYDVALTDVARAETLTDAFGCSETSSHMSVPRSSINAVTLAHELMHAFQYTYKAAGGCDEYRWLREATAEWAENFVYSSSNDEHRVNPFFFDYPDTPLEYRNDGHEYGDWVLGLYLEKKYSPNLIQQIWAKAASNSDSLEAIDATLIANGTSLASLWPDFELQNWNRAPWDFYQSWDSPFPEAAKTSLLDGELLGSPIDVRLNGSGNAILQPNVSVPHLAARYFDFTLGGSGVRSLAFRSLMVDPAHIQALTRKGGAWTHAGDWTATVAPKFFCRDLASEDIDELVLIVSNTSHERGSMLGGGALAPTVAGTNVACRKWTGSFGGSAQTRNPSMELNESWTGSATFERDPAGLTSVLPSTSAAITWTLTGTMTLGGDMCTVAAGPATLTAPEAGEVQLGVTNVDDPRAYRIVLAHTDDVPAELTCPTVTIPYTAHPYSIWLETSGGGASEIHRVGADGTAAGTSGATDSSGKIVSWNWSFPT